MAKSDARFGYQAKLGRELQDLLVDPKGFTCAPGMLCPIFADFASPGDKYYITHSLDFMRTAPLAAPAMCDVKVHYESYFVPIQMLYQPFEQSFFSLTDLQSNFYSTSALQNNNLPLFDYPDYVTKVRAEANTNNARQDAFRFADLLRLNPLNFSPAFSTGTSPGQDGTCAYGPKFFPWQVLAYHCIWQYVYRLDDKISFSNSKFNWDANYSNTTGVQYSGDSGFFGIYQRPWEFDYYTSLYRSPIVSDNNLQSVMPDRHYSDLGISYTRPATYDNLTYAPVNSAITQTVSSLISADITDPDKISRTYSTAMIRQMFANEKLSMITGRTRKTYDSQVLAHFGIDVPHDPKHDIARIGHDVYDLRVGEVTSLASTNDAALGDLAGKGYASSYRTDGHNMAQKHEFVAPCHGVIMTIFSVEPKKRYYGGFARENAVTNTFDFPVPEFDRMGNQPVYRYEAGNINNDSNVGTVTSMTDIIGWNMRYHQWKKRPATCTCAFMAGNAVGGANNWQAYMISAFPYAVVDASNASTYYNNASRPDLPEHFYINRHDFDGLLLQSYSDGWKVPGAGEEGENWNVSPWLVYARDAFIVDSHEVVKKVSFMSKDGEPVYPW